MKRQKPGPKPLSIRDRRSYKVQVPLNSAELAAVRRTAGKESLGAWARGVLVAASRRSADEKARWPFRNIPYPTSGEEMLERGLDNVDKAKVKKQRRGRSN